MDADAQQALHRQIMWQLVSLLLTGELVHVCLMENRHQLAPTCADLQERYPWMPGEMVRARVQECLRERF